jgi:1,4-alpha-glucan branching enzyme
MKWNMGWMHDTLEYFSKDPVHRKHIHDNITFSIWYAFSENFILPLSHDEVVHGKGSLIGKMPGDEWQRHANLRLLFGYMYAHPGKKLVFMGGEFAQTAEWNHDSQVQWSLMDRPYNHGVRQWVRDLNHICSIEPSLHRLDFAPGGFEWLDSNDRESSVVSFVRRSGTKEGDIMVVCNFTPVPRFGYAIPAPTAGLWRELLNSDGKEYGGSGVGNLGRVRTSLDGDSKNTPTLRLTLPPLGILLLKRVEGETGQSQGEGGASTVGEMSGKSPPNPI